MKIVVLGAGGFIGGHLVSRLKKEGHWVRGVNIKTAAGLNTDYINPGGLRHITDYAPSVKFLQKKRTV